MDDLLGERIRYRRKAFLLRLARRLGGEALLFLLARLFYRLRLEGLENIPAGGACLLPFNHASPMADALLHLALRRRRPDVQLFVWRLVGEHVGGLLQAFELPAGEEKLYYAHKRPALTAADLLRARHSLLHGGAVSLAPEGELTWDGRLQHPLAPGCAWLALHTAALVVPAVTLGGYDLQPLWQIEKTRLTGRVQIRIGQPFQLCEQPLEKVEDEQLAAASQRIYDEMAALLDGWTATPV